MRQIKREGSESWAAWRNRTTKGSCEDYCCMSPRALADARVLANRYFRDWLALYLRTLGGTKSYFETIQLKIYLGLFLQAVGVVFDLMEQIQ